MVDIDPSRCGNPTALDALMVLSRPQSLDLQRQKRLENPPGLPAWIDSGGPRSSSKALQPQHATLPEINQAIQNHAAYEATLSVLLGLLAGAFIW